MKHYLLFLTAIAIVAVSSVSCNKETTTKLYSLTAKISASSTYPADLAQPESYSVTFTNVATGTSATLESENNVAVAEDLLSGIYNVTVSASFADGGFEYLVSGATNGVSVVEDGTIVDVKVSATKNSALVFKEIYYTGCKIGEGDYDTYFRDQFYEIYNNSNETVYADSLCICETRYANYDFSVIYDWDIENPQDYVFGSTIWQIPGTGKSYPIKPGESIIVAQWGTNHKAKDLTNGLSPVDLSGAEFEAITQATTVGAVTITDEAAVNMAKVVNSDGYNIPQWLTPVSGGAYIIFKPKKALRNDNFITAINASWSNTGVEIPIVEVIDAVQAISDETRLSTLGLPNSLDAGYIWCSSTYVSESISRKIKETTPEGRVIYQDTNNTKDDFTVNKTPEVRRNGAGVPAWNTWIK